MSTGVAPQQVSFQTDIHEPIIALYVHVISAFVQRELRDLPRIPASPWKPLSALRRSQIPVLEFNSSIASYALADQQK